MRQSSARGCRFWFVFVYLVIKYVKCLAGSRTHCRSVLNQLSGSLAVPCDGTGPLWWTARCPFRLLAAGDGSSSRGQSAASPPFPAPPPTWRMAAGSGPLANGGDSSAPSRMAATPPRPRSTAASLPSHLFFFCSSTTAAGSHWRSPPLPAARSSQHRDLTQQRGLSDSVSLLPPGLRHQCNAVDIYGKKEAGTGEHLNTFNNTINKYKSKAAAPRGRLPHTKHKLKSQAWSSLVFDCCHSSFYSFRSSSVGLETGEWRRCRSLSFTPPASLRSHGSRPRPTRHIRRFPPPSSRTYLLRYIIIHSTGLAPFPRLSAPPHSSHTPIAPRRPGGTHETALYSPLPPLPGGARQGGRGVPGG